MTASLPHMSSVFVPRTRTAVRSIIAGQGTDVIKQIKHIDVIFAPSAGRGLILSICKSVKRNYSLRTRHVSSALRIFDCA